MTSIVCNLVYNEPEIDKKEALRYAGVRGEDAQLSSLLSECYAAALPVLSYKVCYRELSVDAPFVENILASSESVRRMLSGAESVIVFAATVGIELDRLITRSSVVSPTKALLYQAIGAERIEGLCDAFCRDMAERKAAEGSVLTRRFSPGYGDLSISCQRDIFTLLDCPRWIGLVLNDSLLMSPTKSVTALIGVKEK